MAEPKTKRTMASVAVFLKSVEPEARRKECETLVELLQKVTKETPRMWGTSLVGFGSYRYTYANGREGDWPVSAFSPRKANLTVYVMDGFEPHAELMAQLGTFTTGKSCLYVKKLSDVNLGVLEKIVGRSVKTLRARSKA